MADFDFDLLGEIVDNAPTAGFGPNTNYGKCSYIIELSKWDNDEKKFVTRPWTGHDKPAEREVVQFTFRIDVTELNKALEREWKRRVDVRKSGKLSNGEKNPKALTDWEEIVQPSLIALFGKDWMKKLSKGIYVEVEDVQTVALDKEGNPKSFTTDTGTHVNTAPRFTRAFKSKAECQAARDAKYTKKDELDGDGGEGDIPAKVLNDFKALASSLGVDQAMALAEANNLLGGHKATDVATAAGFKPPF